MSILDFALERTTEYVETMPKKERKSYGQFFTSKETAIFMAGLFDLSTIEDYVTVLDPGAGSGILSVALLQRLNSLSVNVVYLVCYENDDRILPFLKQNLEYAQKTVSFELRYEVKSENYILSNEIDYNGMIGAVTNPQKCLI